MRGKNFQQNLIKLSNVSSHLKIGIFLFLILILNVSLFVLNANGAQQRTVSGVVTDKLTGDPLPGVNVIVQGTTVGTATDIDGKYTITILDDKAILVFSFLGYVNQAVGVGSQTNISISLVEQVAALDEVVVVGYGTQKKVNLTGSVASMTSEKLAAVPTANVSTLLYGNLPGLIATQRSGQPGNDPVKLSIRGFDQALVVVDGVVGRDFTRLDPNEIESFTILKDAASAAVYGVSGGNGVILVTTKRGNIGKPTINIQTNHGWQHVTRYPRFVNAEEFAILKNEAAINIGNAPVYTAEEIEKFRNGTDPINYPNVDYYHVFVRDYAPQSSTSITVRGGTEKLKYFFLVGGMKQAAMWNTVSGGDQDFTKYNFRSNVDATINKNLDFSVELGGRREDRDNLVQDSYLMASWMQYQWPIYNPRTPDGKIQATNYGLTAYLDRDLTGYIRNNRYTFESSIALNYKIPFIQGLSARLKGSMDLFFENQKHWLKQYGLFTYNATTSISTQTGAREANNLTLTEGRSQAARIQASLAYDRKFADLHNLSALMLYEEYEFIESNFGASRINYVIPIDQIFAGPDLNKSNSGGASDNGRQSLVGRINYDFSGKYLFEYSFRYDGSAKFPPSKRWGYFSGVSAGWRISEESFFKDNISTINNLKLRASYGILGSDNTGNFQFLTGFTYPSGNYVIGGNVVSNGFVSSGTLNPFITWETSKTFNFGMDISLWNQLIEIEADIFNRDRDGLLATRALQLPITFGATLPSENLNSDNTKGFEILMRHNNSIGSVRYNIQANVAFTKSKWTHVEEREFTSQYDTWRNSTESRWKNRYMGLKAIGQFQSVDELNNSPVQDGKQNSTLRPGDIKFEDFNGDGVINLQDHQPLGRGTEPELNYGLGMSLGWKNFMVSMNWQGSANYVVEMQHFLVQPFANAMSTYAYFMDRWHHADPFDPTSEWIPGKYPTTINDGNPNNRQFSSFWLKDASYLRLKSLNISYELKNDFLNRNGIDKILFSLSGQNLITITGLEYMDPETPNGRLSLYPQQKIYDLGISLTF